LEGFGLQRHEQAADAVSRGDAVGQGEMLGQPGGAILGSAMNGGGSIAAADDAADGDDGDIDHQMLAIARVAGVGEGFEIRADRADIDDLRHERHPWIDPGRPPHAEYSKPITRTESKISSRGLSRQTTQLAQLCALALERGRASAQEKTAIRPLAGA